MSLRFHFKNVILLFSLFFLLFYATGCSSSKSTPVSASESHTNPTVSIALDSGTFSMPFRVAEDQGFFKNNGIQTDFSTFSFGIDTLNAVLTNQADIGIAMDFAALTRLGKGDLKIITRFASPTSSGYQLIVRANINQPEDLTGKQVGVQSGTVMEYLWARYFEKFKIPKSQIKVEPLTSSAEIYAAFERGDIDAAWFSGPYIAKALKVSGAKSLNDLKSIDFTMRGYVVGSGDFIKKNPDTIRKIIKSLKEANLYIKEQPEEVGKLAFKELKLPADDVTNEVKKDWDYDVSCSQMDIPHLKDILDWTTKDGIIKDNFDIKDKLVLDMIK
jgi:ABC-type nitrate/sulfonate/bicarbonate transport system substrate-binding protein